MDDYCRALFGSNWNCLGSFKVLTPGPYPRTSNVIDLGVPWAVKRFYFILLINFYFIKI